MPPASETTTTRFGEQLTALFTAAGSPTLETVARGAAKLAPTRRPASIQRISDWRRGRHLPASFETLEPVIMWLILRAQMRNPEHSVPPLPHWRQWWSLAREDGAAQIPAPGPPIEQPYAGLAPLTVDQHALYFGRDEVLAELAGLITAADADEPLDRIIVVTGVSGAGKSSLLGAGIGRLLAEREGWRSDHRNAVDLLTPVELAEPAEPDAVRIRVVDQCEWLLGGDFDASQVDDGLARLLELAAEPGDVVVLGIRADMYERAAEHPILRRAWQRHSLIVGAMTEEELSDVITKPARLAGLRVEPGLAARIIADLRIASVSEEADNRAGQLPLLAHVLAELAAQRRGESLTLAGYRALGGVGSAIAETAEEAFTSLPEQDQPVAERLLLALVHVAADRVVVRVPLDAAGIAAVDPDHDALTTVIEHLAGARLLVVSDRGIVLIHDAVLTQWPRMAELIERSRVLKPLLQRITVDADAWEASGRDTAQLYDEALFHRSEVVADDPLLPSRARDFLDASAAHLVQTARRRRWMQTAVAMLAVVALAAAGIAVAANFVVRTQRDDARFSSLLSAAEQTRSTDPSLAAQLSVAAWRLRPDDVDARFGVLRTQDLPLPRSSVAAHGGSIYDLVIARGRGLVATAGADRTVRLWDARRPEGPITPFGQPVTVGAFATSVAFTPDGNRLAIASGDGAIAVYDVTDPARPVLQQRLGVDPRAGTAYILAFNPGGTVLATSHDEGRVRLWDAGRGFAPLGSVDGRSGPVRSLAFSPTAPVLAAVTSGGGTSGGAVLVVDVADPAAPTVLATVRDAIATGWHSVAVSPDGRLLAAGRDNGSIGVWDIAAAREPRLIGITVAAHPDAIWSLDFSSDGQTLVSGGLDGAARRWAAGDLLAESAQRQPLQQIGVALRPRGGGVMAADFLTDGTLLTAGEGRAINAWNLPASPVPGHRSPVRRPASDAKGSVLVTSAARRMLLWRIEDGRPRLASSILLPGAKGAVDVAVSPDGRLLAAAAEGGGSVGLYDIADRAHPRLLATVPTRTRHVGLVAFAPDGKTLVVADTDTSLRLWSVADPAAPRALAELTGPRGFVEAADFSPDGSQLAVGSADHRIYRWSVADPARIADPAVDEVHRGTVESVVYSADGRLLYSASDDTTIVVLRVDGESSTVERTLSRPSRVTSLSRSADGKLLASGTDLGTELWSLSDPAAPRHLGTGFSATSDPLLARTVAFAGSERVFVGGHHLLGWWEVDPEGQAKRVCTATGGTLTVEQWRAAAHSLPFRPPCAN